MPHYRDLDKKRRTDEAYRKAHPHRGRGSALGWKYGITTADWDAMLIAQAGRCDICNDPMRVPCVDHDHETGKVRALLCTPCNVAMGHAGDNPERLRKMAEYIEFHRSTHVVLAQSREEHLVETQGTPVRIRGTTPKASP